MRGSAVSLLGTALTVTLLLAGACSDGGGDAPASGGAGGGSSGGGGGGSGGAPSMGGGGGGMGGGGAGPCANDDACDPADGSLCVAERCTKATGQCDAKALVVVAQGRAVDDAQLAGACHFRDLDAARDALTNATARLALYADVAASSAPREFTMAATLEALGGLAGCRHPAGTLPGDDWVVFTALAGVPPPVAASAAP